MSPPLHIALDARWILPEISGIGLYTRELLRQLVRLRTQERFTILFSSREIADRECEECGIRGAESVETLIHSRSPFDPRSHFELARRLRASEVRVFHAPNFILPYPAFPRRRSSGRIAGVATIHDLIPVLFPNFTPRARKNRFRWLIRRMVRETVARADAIITPSESTRQDLLRGIDPEAGGRIHVVPEAAAPRFAPGNEGAREPVILFVGRRDPYKNLPALVRALAVVRRRVPQARLRVIGPPDPRYPEAEQTAEALGQNDAIDWRGYVTGADLSDAFRSAAVFALPSRYEGFGLPVLEAMACGTPVVCGNGSSLPEVTGDAAILIDPDDESALARALITVLTDPGRAAEMSARGRTQSARFSWERTARETMKIYRRIAETRLI